MGMEPPVLVFGSCAERLRTVLGDKDETSWGYCHVGHLWVPLCQWVGLEAAANVGPGSVQAAPSLLSVICLAQVKYQASWLALGMQENQVEYSSLQSINPVCFS